MESKLRGYSRYILSAPLVLALGVLAGVEAHNLPVTSVRAQAINVDYIKRCLKESAALPSHNGLSAHVEGARVLRVGAKALDIHTSDPSCNGAEVFRSSEVVIEQNGKRIGVLPSFINSQNDNGQQIIGNIHTNTAMGCNDIETVTFITKAETSSFPGASATGSQSFSFHTVCK